MKETTNNDILSDFAILDICSEDRYSIDYYAKKDGKDCILTITKVPTSWLFKVNYI